MLRHLKIKNLAIIDELFIEFKPGLNVLTGETGAGKSIIVDALGLALGERAQSEIIRAGREEAIAEAYFEIPDYPFLERLSIPSDNGIITRRIISSSGKNKAYINDTMVNVQTILDLGRSIVDIHGQHEHQSLLSTDRQIDMLDAYGKLLGTRSELEKLFRETESIRKELSELKSNLKEKEHRLDLLRFQTDEIDTASLKAGEYETLTEERSILTNLSKLNELTETAFSLLYGEDGSASEKLSAAMSMLREVSQIDHSASEILSLLESATPLIEDSILSLRGCRDKYDIDPKRVDAVEDRLDLIKRLERKYGEGIDNILKYREDAVEELQGLEFSDERIKELEDGLSKKEHDLNGIASRLSEMRREVSKKTEAAVTAVLKELAMEKAEFRVDIKACPVSTTGADAIQFLFSANKGEPPKPLHKVASGGELSRIMLALKGILAEVDRIPVLIFDEVDAGIGGTTAKHVGMRLKSLAKRHQVLCITHLPQIAALADNHMMVEKVQKKDGVCVKINNLQAKEREEEIARMLSGKITDISLKHARELLNGESGEKTIK